MDNICCKSSKNLNDKIYLDFLFYCQYFNFLFSSLTGFSMLESNTGLVI